MTKTDRVLAALRGDEVDRVPVSAWWHDFAREWSAKDLAEATLEAYRRYDWDFIKVNPRATYYAEAWGARFEQRDGRQPDLIEPSVSSLEHLRGVQPQDGRSGVWAEQLEALRLIAVGLNGEAPFLQTVFSPLAAMSWITGHPVRYVQRLMLEDPDGLVAALGNVAETLAMYSTACLEAGAAGIFFATVAWGSADAISIDDYNRFARPFDLRVLEAVKEARFNVLHVCRDHNHLRHLLDYPVAAFHWAAHSPTNPSLAEIAPRTDRALMGGVSQETTIISGSPDDVEREARSALGSVGGKRFLLAPGCSIDANTPEANLRALVEAAHS